MNCNSSSGRSAAGLEVLVKIIVECSSISVQKTMMVLLIILGVKALVAAACACRQL